MDKPTRRTLTVGQMEVREDLVKAMRDMLVEHGLSARDPRFPWAMHHAYYRKRVRIDGRRARHSDVSALLEEWASGQPDTADIWQAAAGAAAALGASSLPRGIREALRAQDPRFDEWLCTRKDVSLAPDQLLSRLPGPDGP